VLFYPGAHGVRLLFVYVTADRSFRSLILQAWPLLSLDKEQLSTAYLTQHIIETAGMWYILLIIDRVAGDIIRLVASVCVSVCPFALSCLNRLTLIFGMRVDRNLG